MQPYSLVKFIVCIIETNYIGLMEKNFNMDCLRSFTTIASVGNQAGAAEIIGRSKSAISHQMLRLEESVGQRLFQRSGRQWVLSPIGEEFLEHARAILAVNDAASSAFSKEVMSGFVQMGAVQDFAEDRLPRLLAEFSSRYPETRTEVLVDRSKYLIDAVRSGRIEHAIAYENQTSLESDILGSQQMVWLGARNSDVHKKRPLPLVLIEGDCSFRESAIASLNKADIPWHISLTSPSLSCITAAVENGLGVTVRTHEILNGRWRNLCMIEGLPDLPKTTLRIYRNNSKHSPAAQRLREYCINAFASG